MMNFLDAVAHLRAGKNIKRERWNHYLFLTKGEIPSIVFDTTRFYLGVPNVTSLFESGDTHRLPAIYIRHSSGDIISGWVAHSSDIFAEDWEIYND